MLSFSGLICVTWTPNSQEFHFELCAPGKKEDTSREKKKIKQRQYPKFFATNLQFLFVSMFGLCVALSKPNSIHVPVYLQWSTLRPTLAPSSLIILYSFFSFKNHYHLISEVERDAAQYWKKVYSYAWSLTSAIIQHSLWSTSFSYYRKCFVNDKRIKHERKISSFKFNTDGTYLCSDNISLAQFLGYQCDTSIKNHDTMWWTAMFLYNK